MNKKFDFKKTLRTTLGVGLALSISLAAANASQELAKLSGIEINPSQNGGYNILLNTDKNIKFNKNIQSENNIEIEVQGAEISKPINTVYNNATSIDHVLFKPSTDGNVKIMLQGQNIASSNISVASDTLPQDITSNSKDTVYLNRPMNSYSPVVSEENTEATENVYSSFASSLSLRKLINKTSLGWLLSLAMLVIFFASSVKRNKEKNNINIKLSEDSKEREMSLSSQLGRRKGTLGVGLGSIRPEEEISAPIHKQAYGLRAYENSQINPQNRNLKASGISRPSRSAFTSSNNLNKPAAAQKRRTTAPKTSTLAATKKDIQTAQGQIDSIKFLESMAKIYEKSGRVDLANGLQSNILRARKTR
jgi:hypothetical protein